MCRNRSSWKGALSDSRQPAGGSFGIESSSVQVSTTHEVVSCWSQLNLSVLWIRLISRALFVQALEQGSDWLCLPDQRNVHPCVVYALLSDFNLFMLSSGEELGWWHGRLMSLLKKCPGSHHVGSTSVIASVHLLHPWTWILLIK